jgi:hypothetical protein
MKPYGQNCQHGNYITVSEKISEGNLEYYKNILKNFFMVSEFGNKWRRHSKYEFIINNAGDNVDPFNVYGTVGVKFNAHLAPKLLAHGDYIADKIYGYMCMNWELPKIKFLWYER